MKTFDDIQVQRPELAKSYLQLLRAQPGRPIAMFAERRVGKTYFLDHDLAPAASADGLLPVYADLWLQRGAPLEAINHALEEALDDVTVPQGAAGRLAKTPVRKLGLLGQSIDLGDAPTRRALPAAPELRLDTLVLRLMLDEIQALGDAAGGEGIVAALRAVLHKRRTQCLAVFTGSSQEGLARMVATAGAPMYQFAQLLNFPPLGDEFLTALARHYTSVHRGRRLLLDDLRRVYAQIGFKPGLMRDIVKGMSAEGITDVDLGVQHMLTDERQVAGWTALLQSLPPFDLAVLLQLAQGRAPLGKEALQALGGATVAKSRAAVERLRRLGLVSKSGQGPGSTVRIDDPLLTAYLQGKGAGQVV
jgi:hypothetical protein